MKRFVQLSCGTLAAATCALCLSGPAAAQAPADPTILIRGCVVSADTPQPRVNQSLLVWSDENVMLTNVVTESAAPRGDDAVGTSGTQPVFYWLDDNADDVAAHMGKTVEITGRMEREYKKGEMEIDFHDTFTEVEFEAHGEEVKARVPAGYLGEGPRKDTDYDVVLRDVDVKNVRVLSEGCAS